MYRVETIAGNYLARFAAIGNAREFAKANRPARLVNKRGKVIATF